MAAGPALKRGIKFRDLVLFYIVIVISIRWTATAAAAGPSILLVWIAAVSCFFVPLAACVMELSSRHPEEGGLYVWTKEAFGDFHGFVAGWTYWTYTIFYFPGLLMASSAMSAYVGGIGAAHLAQDRTFLLVGSFVLLFAAVYLNIKPIYRASCLLRVDPNVNDLYGVRPGRPTMHHARRVSLR